MPTDDASDAIREILAAPRPVPPRRADFATEELFEDAWLGWQGEALDRAEQALGQVASVLDEQPGAIGTWVPRDLVAVAMLRAEVARERALPDEHRFFDHSELDRVGRMLDRLDPQVSVGSEHGPTGLFWGPASTAHQYLPPGVYEAVEVSTGDPYRLVVGPVAGQVAGEASAAFPRRAGAEQTLDEVAAVLGAVDPGAPTTGLERVRALVADTGRAVDAGTAPASDLSPDALARLDASLGTRATRLGVAAAPERETPAGPDVVLGR